MTLNSIFWRINPENENFPTSTFRKIDESGKIVGTDLLLNGKSGLNSLEVVIEKYGRNEGYYEGTESEVKAWAEEIKR